MKMKAFALGLGAWMVIGLSAGSIAMAQIGLSSTPGKSIQCSLSQIRDASSNMKQASKNAITQSMICTSGTTQQFEVGFLGVDFPNLGTYTDSGARITANVDLACANSKMTGIYFYGGYPVGFQTRTKGYTPYFSSQESGRCFLQGNSPLLQNVNALINQSAMVILAVDLP